MTARKSLPSNDPTHGVNDPTHCVAKLDPEWRPIGANTWAGYGQEVGYVVEHDFDEVYSVSLHHRGSFIRISRTFPSLSSAQRFCERYFG